MKKPPRRIRIRTEKAHVMTNILAGQGVHQQVIGYVGFEGGSASRSPKAESTSGRQHSPAQ